MGLLRQPGVKGADKYQYEETAGAAKCAGSTEREEKMIKIACNLFVSLEEGKKKLVSHKTSLFDAGKLFSSSAARKGNTPY